MNSGLYERAGVSATDSAAAWANRFEAPVSNQVFQAASAMRVRKTATQEVHRCSAVITSPNVSSASSSSTTPSTPVDNGQRPARHQAGARFLVQHSPWEVNDRIRQTRPFG